MYGLILAGGSGSRLWPMSRELYPKQLMNYQDEDSLLQATYKRLMSFLPAEKIIATTGVKHCTNVKHQLSKIAKDVKILSEPISRNTAPAIAVAVMNILVNGQDDVILVLPSDHLIKDVEGFLSTVKKGEELARKGYLVTFGVQPSYPETGYGYINVSDEKIENGVKVNKFVEKPDYELAKKYVDLFCKKNDVAKQLVQQWIPIVAASQSVKNKPEEKELLTKWIDVVEYE